MLLDFAGSKMTEYWAASVSADGIRSDCWPLATISDDFAAAVAFHTRYFCTVDAVVDEISDGMLCH